MATGEMTLGSGTAEQARKALKTRAYQLHVKEAQAMGDTPMTPEEWASAQKNEQAAADQAFRSTRGG